MSASIAIQGFPLAIAGVASLIRVDTVIVTLEELSIVKFSKSVQIPVAFIRSS
jgi:hypothetical protein